MTDSKQQPRLSKEEIDSVIALYSNGQYQEAINQIKVLNKLQITFHFKSLTFLLIVHHFEMF